ncbi:hypothetical protein ACHAQH_001883 [Verticillium albo-atrum]
MSSSERKDRSSSHKKSHGSSPKGHHHKASDSGVGSLSDQDSLAANPDRVFTAQDYQQQSQSPRALREALDNSRFELGQWKERYRELEADLHVSRSEHRNLDASFRALSERNTLLENEQKANAVTIRALREVAQEKAKEADSLRENLRRLRHSPPQEPNISVPLGPGPSRASPETKLPRAESSKKDKHRDEKARHAEDKERLRSRFDNKDEQGPSSSHSGHSGHSGRSGHSGHSRRESYIEPFGHGGKPVAIESLRSGRDYVTYSTSSTRPPIVTSSSTPRSPLVPPYAAPYNETVFYDDSEHEHGDYVAHPLPEKKHKSRR